jgi:hypothetical protein
MELLKRLPVATAEPLAGTLLVAAAPQLDRTTSAHCGMAAALIPPRVASSFICCLGLLFSARQAQLRAMLHRYAGMHAGSDSGVHGDTDCGMHGHPDSPTQRPPHRPRINRSHQRTAKMHAERFISRTLAKWPMQVRAGQVRALSSTRHACL